MAPAGQPDALTENAAPAFASTGNEVLDLFFSLAETNPKFNTERLSSKVLAAAQAAPQDTLRVIFHARDCRKGKGIRTQALHSLGTFMLACSQRQHVLSLLVGTLPDFGRFRDLFDLVRQLESRDPALSPSCREAVLCAYLGQLQADLAVLQANNRASISLAAKWLTSERKRGLAKVSIVCMLCASVLAHQHGCAFAFWLASTSGLTCAAAFCQKALFVPIAFPTVNCLH